MVRNFTYLQTVDVNNGCACLAAYCLAILVQFLPLLIVANSFGLFNGTTSWSKAFATSVTVDESKQDLIGVTQRKSNSLISLQKSAPCINLCWISLGSVKNMKRFYRVFCLKIGNFSNGCISESINIWPNVGKEKMSLTGGCYLNTCKQIFRILKWICPFSNTFWLFQHRVKYW